MRVVFLPPSASCCLLAALICGGLPVLIGHAAPPNESASGSPDAPGPTGAIDPRFRTPRATVRTFLIAMNQTEDDPHRIVEATRCLDLSGMPPDRRDGGQVAFELEFILRSTNIPTGVIPNEPDGSECTIGENKDIKLTLRRTADGRWLFDGKTLQDLPKMRLSLWQHELAASHAKDTGDVPSAYRSPYAMYRTFVDSLKHGDLDTAATCLDLTEIPGPARRIIGRELAIKLKEVLDRTRFLIFQDIPDSSVGVPLEALVHREGRIVAERQAGPDRKGEWLFNRATVGSVGRLYDAFETQPILPELAATGRTADWPGLGLSPGLWLRHRIPSWLGRRITIADQLSFALYQIAGLLLLGALVVPVYRLVVWLLEHSGRVLVRWRGIRAGEREPAAWVRPIAWVAVVWMLVRGVTVLDLPTEAAGAVLAVLVPALWLATALAAYQLIDPLLKLMAGPAVRQEGAATLAAMGFPVFSLVLKIVVVVWGLAAVLRLFNFDVGTVLAGLGIGGLAFALAAQDTLKNFFGSVMLIADRTFRVGDLVRIGENEGVVESVGLRSTRIRALDDALLTVPNSDLTTAHVTNFGARRYRRFRTTLCIAHGTPTERLIAFRNGILERLRTDGRVRLPRDEVAVNNLGTAGIEMLVQVFFEVPDGHAEIKAREDLVLDILRLAERLEISFDAPTIASEGESPGRVGAAEGDSATTVGP